MTREEVDQYMSQLRKSQKNVVVGLRINEAAEENEDFCEVVIMQPRWTTNGDPDYYYFVKEQMEMKGATHFFFGYGRADCFGCVLNSEQRVETSIFHDPYNAVLLESHFYRQANGEAAPMLPAWIKPVGKF